jgi:hypothetical protein
MVREQVQLSERDDLVFIREEPFGHKDWNDALRAKPQTVYPCRPEVPSVA